MREAVVSLHLHDGGAVLEREGYGFDGAGQLARLAHRHEADAQLRRQGHAEHEAARLHAQDDLNARHRRAHVLRERLCQRARSARVTQEWEHVEKEDPGLGEVGVLREQLCKARALLLNARHELR